MAAKKKAKAKKKAPAKKATAKKTKAKKSAKKSKTVARKSKKAPAKKAPAKAAKKKAKKPAPGILSRAITAVTKAVTPAKPKKKKQIVGEGDYAATRKYDADQVAFVKKNKAKIPEMAKDAQAALDGPEGDSLRAAEEAGRAHSVAGPEE